MKTSLLSFLDKERRGVFIVCEGKGGFILTRKAIDMLHLMIGAFLFAVSINALVIPLHLSEGGVTGLSIIFYYLFHLSPSISTFALNGILLMIGYKFLDGKTIIYTIIAVTANSLFLHLTSGWVLHLHETWIGIIFAGVVSGTGVGMILRAGGTTAGSVILARIANKYLDWSISYATLFFDVLVVFSSFFLIGVEKVMLTIAMLYVGAKVMDFVVEGLNTRKAVTIISSKKDEIAAEINDTLERGVTLLHGQGNYTKESKDILYVVINKQELLKLKKIIKRNDPRAFVIIHDVRAVFGKGFLDM
ncbi:YitT family protein [Sporolactobacillus sp. THM7-4]|nr:YitT family protein [Sporolactobacillus sp. THM7-4]